MKKTRTNNGHPWKPAFRQIREKKGHFPPVIPLFLPVLLSPLLAFCQQTPQGLTEKELAALPEQAIRLVAAARSRIGVTLLYDPAYVSLKYPGGDVSGDRGVCTDVIIRSLRKTGHDLQKLVHLDMRRNFRAYPKTWGLKRPDRNIDHRRVPNLRAYFKRKGLSLPVTKKKGSYLPGDFVTCSLGAGTPHIMLVSDRKAADGTPLVIHNIGSGTEEEDSLFSYPITGHYRWFRKTRPSNRKAADT